MLLQRRLYLLRTVHIVAYLLDARYVRTADIMEDNEMRGAMKLLAEQATALDVH